MHRSLYPVVCVLLFAACSSSESARMTDVSSPDSRNVFTDHSAAQDETTRHSLALSAAGLPSFITERADSLAQRSWVSRDREHVADSIKSVALDLIRQADSLIEVEDSNVTAQSRDSLALSMLSEALALIQKGVAEDPFELELYLLGAQAEVRRASLDVAASNMATATDWLDTLRRRRPGDYIPWMTLGDVATLQRDWRLAATAYSTAETNYLFELEIGADSLEKVDDRVHHEILFGLGLARMEQHKSDDAIEALFRAREVAPTVEAERAVESWIEFIEWDNGNIVTRRMYDTLLTISPDSLALQYDGYSKLRPLLSKPSAQDEIAWRLARIETNLGEFDQAAARLWSLVQRAPKEVGTGVPLDSTYYRYFEDFGRLTFDKVKNAGSTPEKRDLLERAVLVPWSGRPDAQVQLAVFLQRTDSRRFLLLAEEGAANSTNCDSKRLAYRLLSAFYARQDVEKSREYSERFRDAC